MPDTQVNPAEHNKRLALDPQTFGGYYVPYVTGSTGTDTEKALTAYFHAYEVLGRIFSEDELTPVFGEMDYMSGSQASDGHYIRYTLYSNNPRRISSLISNYWRTKLSPQISALKGNAEQKAKLDELTAIKNELNAVFKLVSSDVLTKLSSAFAIIRDPEHEALSHVWSVPNAQYARTLATNLRNVPLPFNGTALNGQSLDRKNDAKHSVDDDLSTFFGIATRNKLPLHPMQAAEGVPRSNDLFMYHLSPITHPKASAYFASCTDVVGANEDFIEATKRLAASIQDADVYALAQMNQNGSARWSYFGDKDTAVAHMGALAVSSNPEFRSRLHTAFGESEAFKNHSNHDDVADFIIGFLLHPDHHRFNVLTAYTTDKSSKAHSLTDLPEVSGILLQNSGGSVSVSFFDAAKVFQHLINNKAHLDKHGSDLLDNLVKHGMWANLIDFCSSIFNERDLIAAGGGDVIDLPKDPTKRIIKFHALLNAHF